MRRSFMIAAAVAASVVTADADAQWGGLLFGKALGMPAKGEAGGAYQTNNQIRTTVSDDQLKPTADLFRKAIVKAGEMARDKDFPAFGVTKYECTLAKMGGTTLGKGCYVIAIMLKQGEQARPRGKRPVLYYAVDDVLAGTIALPPEDEKN